MKKMIITLLLTVVFGVSINAQALTDGKYTAKMSIEGEISYAYFTMKDGKVHQTGVSPKIERTISNATTTNYTWLNNAGVWSECQTYTFTMNKDDGKMYISMIRFVQNEGSIPWGYYGVGIVTRD